MALYLGNQLIGNGIYLGNNNITDANVFLGVPSTTLEYLVVAGGGGGGYTNSNGAGGGGAGGFQTGSVVTSSVSLSVVVGVKGNGGTSGVEATAGTNSSLIGGNISLTSTGGGRGGSGFSSNGGNGGSGGGCTISATPGTGTSGQGFNGSIGTGSPTFRGGGGGGAGSAGTTTAAGNGKTWLDGVIYSHGGRGYNSAIGGDTTYGSGGNGLLNPAAGANDGQNGVVIVRYEGPQRATGGTITSSGGYTYHTFTTDGTFTL